MRSHRDSVITWIVAIVVAIAVTVAVIAWRTSEADAYRVSASSARARILDTNYGGWCGKGTWWRCAHQAVPIVAPSGAHSYTFLGYYQERKLLRPMRQCSVAGWVYHRATVTVTWRSCW